MWRKVDIVLMMHCIGFEGIGWLFWQRCLQELFTIITSDDYLVGTNLSLESVNEQNRGNWMAKTSWSLLEVASRLIALAAVLLLFLPNLWYELALSMSFSVVLLIGIVPSGHVSPPFVHSWKLSGEKPDMGRWPFGRSGGSWTQHIEK